MKDLIKRYSIRELKNDISRYGFSYSTKDFLIEMIVIIGIVLFVAYISRLRYRYMLALVLIAMALIPPLIQAWFRQNYNIRRFTMLSDYLSNIIPIFMQKTKIRYTLGELFDITSGLMKDTIGKALDYLDNTVDDPDLNRNALKIIEDEFPNSRVKSAHKLILSIEASNSLNYEDVCENLYDDIEKWIKRVYTFQKDLKNRRTKLLILCLATLFMNSVFVYFYVANDYFIGFTESPVYQISTLIFIAIILVTITIIMIRLNGEWLINDMTYRKDEELRRKYILYKDGQPKARIVTILVCLICVAGGVYLGIINRIPASFLCFGIALMVFFDSPARYHSAYKSLSKNLTIEFPVWLREISLALNSYTVLNAIENSQNITSYPLRKELRKFLDEAKKDPTSIRPYNEFLSEFDLEDARSSMKVLYAIQNIGKEDVKVRVSNLILRNQEMLDKAESIRNNDSISGIEALGYVPVAVFSGQMLISMFAMFTYMMNLVSGAINL